MDTPFRKKIRAAIADPALQVALDNNAIRRTGAHDAALGALPDLPEMRRQAHAIRQQTIQHLEEYLAQFQGNLERNGWVVHHASDAQAACQRVIEIAQKADAHLVAKSKSMVSEEIELNHALEAAGFTVVETDLGEFIVQLRKERPAHIISPAIHLRKEDVARLFSERFGESPTASIPEMTRFARGKLRDIFLTADVGLTGVNFGVAETGAICLVTNEGNGRMVTTLPRVHIALMGIERLVPTSQDLATLLNLLARSATGQKLSVYTQLVQKPRAAGEMDGAMVRHLVLVDNGRSSLRHSPLEEALLCIRCGACLNACPVFREIGGHSYVGRSGAPAPYPGPIGSIVSPGIAGQAEFGHLARASSLCGACREACPVDIDLPRLLLRVRTGSVQIQDPPGQAGPRIAHPPTHIPAGIRRAIPLFAWIAARPEYFHTFQRLAGFLAWLVSPFQRWMRLPAFTGWGASRRFPRPAIRPFHARFASLQQKVVSTPARRVNLETRRSPSPSEAKSPVSSPPNGSPGWVEAFIQAWTAAGGTLTRCTAGSLPRVLLEELKSRQVSRLQTWDEDQFPPGLLAALRLEGVHLSSQPDPAAQAGLTGAQGAIAATGSLVLASSPTCPLTPSLLPPVHFAILLPQSIVPDLAAALHLPEVQQAPSVSIITGPSRTADIEMALTIGVHGPGATHIFLVTG